MAEIKKPLAAKADSADGKPKADFFTANRESVESIVVAVILALLFRAFVAEAFVIPTGSMAPTLMGRHVDVWCDECQYHYQASASSERDRDDSATNDVVVDSRCPNCGFRKPLDRSYWSNENSFSGDRIIVSKFAYELGSPQRWDVIVFKFPGSAQQNYIKRLVGLPNETLKMIGGNIYTKPKDAAAFAIERKPDSKLLTLLQVVHDSAFPAPALQKAGWPARWQSQDKQNAWQANENETQFSLAASSDDAWLRYHHVDPFEKDWKLIAQGRDPLIDPDWRGGLISDFYAYNSARSVHRERNEAPDWRDSSAAFGLHWVDDLALECEIQLSDATGEVLLEAVRAGVHYTCRIDAKTGKATLQARDAEGKAVPFGEGEKAVEVVAAQTSVRGAGTYHLRLSNVDHEVRMWDGGWRVAFDGPTTYASEELVYPDVASIDGDVAPVAVGGKNQSLSVRNLRVLRDKYYIACDERYGEYEDIPPGDLASGAMNIADYLAFPDDDRLDQLLRSRRHRQFTLDEGQYLPLGDNSPASSDARYWPDGNADWKGPYVEEHLLVGKALFIYWPHSWNSPMFLPNVRRMQPIR